MKIKLKLDFEDLNSLPVWKKYLIICKWIYRNNYRYNCEEKNK